MPLFYAPLTFCLGGLAKFEEASGVSAPGFIEHLVKFGSENPNDPLPPDSLQLLSEMVRHCSGSRWFTRGSPSRLLRRCPEKVAIALRAFLEDPLPQDVALPSKERSGEIDPPSILDMRAAWLADGGDPGEFNRMTLWEHARIVRAQRRNQRAALADAALAARVARAKDEHFRKFIDEMSRGPHARTQRDWAQHLFAASAGLPTFSQEELALMKGVS